MRKCASLLLAILLLGMCLACQPTPEEDAVVSRDSEIIKEKLGSGTPIPVEQTPAPEDALTYKKQLEAYLAALPDHWSDQIDAYVDLSIEADIIVDNGDILPVYEISRSTFGCEQVTALANVFFSDVTGIREGREALPEEYAQAIDSLNERGFLKYSMSQFKKMQQAPEGEYTEADEIPLLSQCDYIVRFGDNNLGEIFFEDNYIEVTTHLTGMVHLAESTMIDGSYDGEGPVIVDPPITQEQAEEVLNTFLQDAGLEGFTIESTSAARYFSFLYRQEINQGWRFTLMRTYGYTAINTSNLSEGLFRYEDTEHSRAWEREVMHVYVSENGVEFFNWYSPGEITGIAAHNVELMDFEQIQNNAKKLLTAGISWMESDLWKGEMTKMVLTVILQQVPDEPDKAYLMPVWVMLVDWYFDGDYMSTTGVGINALNSSRAIMN